MAIRNHATERAIGARVRLARIEKRISQGALGEQLGISFQQVQKYELGRDRISASQLLKIARALQQPVSYFYEDLGDPGDAGPALADIVDRRTPGRSRGAVNRDIKVIGLLGQLGDVVLKAKVVGLIEAIVAAQQPAETPALPPQAAE